MKGQHRRAPARIQALRQLAQECLQRRKLIVDRHAHGLKNPPDGQVALLLAQARQGGPDGPGQRACAAEMLAGQGGRQQGGARFVRVLLQQFPQGLRADAFQKNRRRLPPLRIHPHVQRPVVPDREAPARIIQLHGRNAQVRQDHIRALEARLPQRLWQAGEIAAARGEDLHPEPQPAQTRLGFGKLDRVGIQPQQPAAGLDARQQFPRVSAEPQGAIHRHLAGTRRQRLQRLRRHDWPVRPCRRFARRQDFGHRLRVTRRIVFLVFLLETARVCSGIPRASLMRHGRRRGSVLVIHHAVKVSPGGVKFKNVVGRRFK